MCTSVFRAALFTIAKIRNQPIMYTMECFSAIKKNKILLPAATWMDLEGIVLSEVSQTEKDKYGDITYMWNLQNTRNSKDNKKKQTLTYIENKPVVAMGRGIGGAT